MTDIEAAGGVTADRVPAPPVVPTVEMETLRQWLESGIPVTIVDVRPAAQRAEWHIPGSLHIDASEALRARIPGALDAVSQSAVAPVVAVCAMGRTSLLAVEALRARGIDARSLNGGMRAWSLAWNIAELPPLTGNVTVIQVRRTGKGCLSYMVAAGGEAAVIDASVEPEVYRNIAARRGWRIAALVETHVHADHLSRSRAIADALGAAVYLPEQERVSFPYVTVQDGDVIPLGGNPRLLRALRTPGHTTESTCYLLGEAVLFSGDTLFLKGVGRPDLEGGAAEAAPRAHELHRSLQRLVRMPGNPIVLPSHTPDPVRFDGLLIGTPLDYLRRENRMLCLGEEEFVDTITAGIPPTPANYAAIVARNQTGLFPDVDPTILEAGSNRCAVG